MEDIVLSGEQTIDVLLRLIDDPDEEVYAAVEERIKSLGPDVLVPCSELLRSTEDPRVKGRLETIITVLKTQPLDQLVALIRGHQASGKDVDLEVAISLLDRFSDPSSDSRRVSDYLDELALRVHEEFIAMSPAVDLTHLLSVHSVLYEEEGLQGAFKDFYDPRNNNVFNVVERKIGSPIALSVIELLLAERVGLDLKGIGLPAHFILYCPALDVFIDPFHHGRFLSLPDLEPSHDLLKPTSNIYIIMRMMRNLERSFTRRQAEVEAESLRVALASLEHNPTIDPS